ncbi:hypothetical protein KUTeg_006926 [Tegillarca granosa]|uniref:Aminotransferase class V domain-containing protein n=1 Tax=Tegillarca granosa TaxID=220873 RepID=A0ABQ9FDQ6_TEGGR|nr:hypothetical protein KUTeg_006926 [Tegillarca granosa]
MTRKGKQLEMYSASMLLSLHMAAKRDFGSFHSSNVQETYKYSREFPNNYILSYNVQIYMCSNFPSQSDVHAVLYYHKDYIPPLFPFQIPEYDFGSLDSLQFGKECREKCFMLEEDCTFINHGAFGGVLKDALDIAQKWQRYIERQPLRFFDRELLPHLVYVTRRLSKFIGCDAQDVVLVTNATTAINTVVRSAVKKLLRQVCTETGTVLQEEKVEFPVTGKQQIISLVKSTLKSGTKLAVFDHIPSNSPLILPIKEIIQVCHERNVPVLIDGAHALGSVPLNLRSLDADYYVSNAHKWFCCPKGAAFLYVRKDLQKSTRPLVISHGFGSGFNSEFIWAGLHDYSPFLAMHVVLNFWEGIGSTKIQQYMCQ